MNHMRIIGLALVAAIALTAAVAGNASATTLEIGGVAQSKAVVFEASATSSTVFAKTDGSEANSCSVSTYKGTTSVFSGPRVTGSLSELSFKTCKLEALIVDTKGGLYFEHEVGTTSASVFSENAQWTQPTSFGFSVTCSTGSGTKIGTVDGVASISAHATITINAVLSCGFLLPSATLKGAYKVSAPTGLGVVA
jgi:hypothetical protein